MQVKDMWSLSLIWSGIISFLSSSCFYEVSVHRVKLFILGFDISSLSGQQTKLIFHKLPEFYTYTESKTDALTSLDIYLETNLTETDFCIL